MESTVTTSFAKVLFALIVISLFTGACQKGLSESDVQTQVAATITALVPTVTPIPPTNTPTPTKISTPTKTLTPTITPTLPPLGVHTLNYYIGKTVEISGYLCLPSMMFTSQYSSTYTIYLVEDERFCSYSNEEHYSIEIPIGLGNNQIEPLPKSYSSYDLIIRDENGNVIQGEVYVTIKGRVTNSSVSDYYPITFLAINP